MDTLELIKRRAVARAQRAELAALAAGWPTDATLLQGFLNGRFQRRDGDSYQQPLPLVRQSPSGNRRDTAWVSDLTLDLS